MFEPAWSTRTVEDDPGAPFFNDTTKYVVSGTLSEGTWRNSEIVGAYDPERIRRLKEESEGDLYMSGSITLVRALLDDGLIDGLHLFVYPLTRGAGPRLFPEDAPPKKFSLEASDRYDNGVVYLNYRPQSEVAAATQRRRSNSSATPRMCVSSSPISSRTAGDRRAPGRVTIANVS